MSKISEKAAALNELREAVETKVRAEIAAERDRDATTRNALLDATLNVDAKTQHALEICHACDRPHVTRDVHDVQSRVGERVDNVVAVDFRPDGLHGGEP